MKKARGIHQLLPGYGYECLGMCCCTRAENQKGIRQNRMMNAISERDMEVAA